MKKALWALALAVGFKASIYSAAAQAPVARYDLNVTVNLAKPSLAVRGTVAFTVTERNRDSVEVILHRNLGRPTWRLHLPAGSPRYTLRADTSETVSYYFRYARRQAVGSTIKLAFDYEGGQRSAFQLALDSTFCMAGGYGTAWYPQVIEPQPDHGGNIMEGVGTLAVTVPSGFTPVLAGSHRERPERRAGRAGRAEVTRFRYQQSVVFSLYVGRYWRTDYRIGSRPFTAYRLRADTATATYLRRCATVLDALSEEFSPYPYDDFTLLEFPERVAQQQGIGGASVKAGIVMPSSVLGGRFNFALFGHELSHQWWGNLVNSAGKKGSGMLSEGMAQFGSLQVVKRFDPTRAEAYRRTGYPGYIADQSGLGYLLNAASGNDSPLADLDFRNAHSIGDSKGFLVLELLSETIGKPRMQAALLTICQRYAAKPLSWESFMAEVQQASGRDLGWFYEQWFDRPGAPAWQFSWRQPARDTLDLTVTQTAPYYRLDLELLAASAMPAQSVVQTVTIPAQSVTHLRVPVSFRVQQVELDPAFRVLHWTPAYKEQASALAGVQRVVELRRQGKTDEAIKQCEAALTSLSQAKQPDRYGAEFSLCYYMGRLKSGQGNATEAQSYYLRALKCSSRDPSLLAYTYFRLAELAKAKGDTPAYEWAKANALNADLLNNQADNMTKLLASNP